MRERAPLLLALIFFDDKAKQFFMKNIITTAALLISALSSPVVFAQMKYKFDGDEAYVEPSEIIVKNACRPEWPRSSLRNNEMGKVDLSLLMNTEGVVVRARLIATSGFRELDRATMTGYIGCKFKPRIKDGVATENWFPVRYIWILE